MDIDKYLISAVSINNRIAKLISSISSENWGYINFPSLSVLFPCAPSHTAWLFEKNYFELKTSSFCFRMCLSLTRQLTPPEKMLTSAAKFNILILWYPVCTPLIPCHSHRSRRRRCLQQHTAKWRVDSPVNILHDEGKGVTEEIIYIVLD